MALQKMEGAVLLPPSVIDPNPDNARYGLKKKRIKDLAESIKIAGGVMEPIEVKRVGDRYQVSFGDYRLAAVNLLAEEGAVDITIPAIIRDTPSGKEGLLRNLAENLEREDLTLMDQASAAKKMLDAGVEKLQVRTLLRRKGRMEPVSNSWLSTTLGFLDLPTKLRTAIHEGKYDWQAAAELVTIQRSHPDKLDDVVAELEAERAKAIERENKEEEKYLSTVQKAEDAQNKAQQTMQAALAKEAEKAKKLEDAKAEIQTIKSTGAAVVAELEEKIKAATQGTATAQETEARLAFIKETAALTKEIGKATDETNKALLKAQKALDALIEKDKADSEAAKKKAAEAKEEAAKAKQDAKTAKDAKQPGNTPKKKVEEKTMSATEVKKAAKNVGVPVAGKVPLNRKDIMAYVATLRLPGGQGKAEVMVRKIGDALDSAFNSGLTDKQLYSTLLAICSGK